MLKRLTLVTALLVCLVPLAAHADDPSLGPQTNAADTSGPDRGTSQLLQPASPTTSQSLQSADAVEGGLPQVTTNSDIQSAGNSQDISSLLGPNDASDTHRLSETPNTSPVWLVLAIIVVTIAIWWWDRRSQPQP